MINTSGADHATPTNHPRRRCLATLRGRVGGWQRPSPVIELNRAVAVGMADGPAAGLALVDALAESGALAGYYLLPATRADLLRRLGQRPEAAASYREAFDLAVNDAERRYLARRLAEVNETPAVRAGQAGPGEPLGELAIAGDGQATGQFNSDGPSPLKEDG